MVKQSRRIEPISLAACPFCHGECGATGRSRMRIARRRRMKTSHETELLTSSALLNDAW
jgi:hypothetical protein